MKRVKDLKVGDRVYPLTDRGENYNVVVKEIKKKGTLATVKLVHKVEWFIREDEEIEFLAYGHVSSRTLSWYSRKCWLPNEPITTEITDIEHLKEADEIWRNRHELGSAVETLVRAIRNI